MSHAVGLRITDDQPTDEVSILTALASLNTLGLGSEPSVTVLGDTQGLLSLRPGLGSL